MSREMKRSSGYGLGFSSFPFPFPGIRNSFYSETLHTNFLSFIQQSLFLGYLLCLALAAFPPQSSTCLLRVHIRSCCRARELGTRAVVYGVRQASAVLEAPLRTIQARQQITINLSQGAPTVIEAHLPVGWCTKTALCLFGSPGMDGCGSGSDPFGSND